jgi:citrate lyase beta subunit
MSPNMAPINRVRRAQMYVPGDDMHKIQKAAALGVDSLILDIEDGVAVSQKDVARKTIVEALATLDFGRSERLVRINPVESDFEEADLKAILPARPDGIVIPKVERPEHVRWASEVIGEYERDHRLSIGGIRLLILIETARGIVNLREIGSADDRLDALIFGAYDMASSLGATASKDGWEVFYARSVIVTHAAAFGLQAIDSVYIHLQDVDGLIEAATRAMHMGYTGKQVIHPRQIDPVASVFTPTDDAITGAQKLIDAFEEHQRSGKGVFAYDGKMVDAPILREAENILARARAAGK